MKVAHAAIREVGPDVGASTLRWKLGVLVATVGAGDFLLFRHSLGLSVVLFAGFVEIATVLAAGVKRKTAIVCALVGLATLAPIVEDVNVLSLFFALCGAGEIALIANGRVYGSFVERVLQVLGFLAAGPFRILLDTREVGAKASPGGIIGHALIAWVLPIGLGGVFLALFSAANPVIEEWLADIVRSLLALLDIWRIAFWLALFALVWPFVLFRALKWRDRAEVLPARETVGAESGAPGDFLSMFFGEAAILRSLALFNAMFAIQSGLDVTILWRGHSLPAGISFASYAHRGAYPLMATALLAGVFVILAMRPGSNASRSTLIRTLVYVWTAQNVALVISSLYRLDLYVQVYSLTYWRVAAFVWMGLVAVGLVLIIVQLSTRRSNRWLLSANAVATVVALYLSAFANFDYLIADYNLRHCGEVSSDSAGLDMAYMESLGPDAIPVVDAALTIPGSPFASGRLEFGSIHDGRGAAIETARLAILDLPQVAAVALSGKRKSTLDEAMTRTSERLGYAGLTVALVCAGLLCRSPALGLPWLAAKYSGSALWAAMIYASLRAINPRATILSTLEAAIAIAICVEFFRLYQQPELDAFRATLAGQLLLGRIFSPWNIVAYATGIACVALADGRVRRIRERQTTGKPGVAIF